MGFGLGAESPRLRLGGCIQCTVAVRFGDVGMGRGGGGSGGRGCADGVAGCWDGARGDAGMDAEAEYGVHPE